MISDKVVVQDLVHLLKAHNVRHVVISPGSRNAPLSTSFLNDPEISTITLVDERAAGYFALGMAQQLREPVAVCCTSGSAAINYGPAVTEAWYQKIPLVV
ncbi:MAG: 2-succinyl-5-enolpyruvyl-6-hydroxy-3-cyclohexene-1-carboxylate synthase, partial [Flavobacteriales bacterium]|nr:2-succinyl-5-enolpyruvyl-6-hydroxy-3-cyclohexene-1-carboxylate synthase [Flavobacteriales bacterium]